MNSKTHFTAQQLSKRTGYSINQIHHWCKDRNSNGLKHGVLVIKRKLMIDEMYFNMWAIQNGKKVSIPKPRKIKARDVEIAIDKKNNPKPWAPQKIEYYGDCTLGKCCPKPYQPNLPFTAKEPPVVKPVPKQGIFKRFFNSLFQG